MQQIPTFDKIEWSFETPEIVKIMIKKLDDDLKQIQTVLDCGWVYLSKGWIQTFQELNDLFKNKVTKQYIENFEHSMEQTIESSTQQIETNEEENNQEFENLTQINNSLIKINHDVPHEEKHIQSIRLDYLQPAMQTQVQSLKNVQKYQNEAKEVSIGISKQLQAVKDQMLVDNNKLVVLQTQADKTQNDLNTAIQKYKRQLPEAQKIYEDMKFNIKAQNLENSFQTFNNILQDLKQENLKLINELNISKIDYKHFEMEQLLQQIEQLEQLQLQYTQQFTIDLAETETKLMEMIQAFLNKFQLQFKSFVDDMRVKSVQITDLIEECFKNNKLQQVEKQINEAQQRWSDDIQNFREKYIEGALQDVQDLIVDTFEKNLVIDAANILQNAKVFQNQLEEKHGQQKETQLSRKLFFEKETKRLDQKLGVEHRRALQMSTDRYEKIQKTVAHIGQNFDEILKKVETLINSIEFVELIDKKLDKASVDIAFSVQCPSEQYEQNPYSDTSQLSTARIGGAPLNISVQTAKERIEYLRNQQEMLNNSINLSGNQINNMQAKYDGLLIKIEDALNALGFGKEKPSIPKREDIIGKIVNYDEKRSRELSQRVKSGARAYRSRQWRTGIDLDNYIAEFQEEFGKSGKVAQ